MGYTLTPVKKGEKLTFDWFPTAWQAVVFRNWGIIDVGVIARVIKTDTETVISSAAEMGLDPSVKADPQWLTKGYITVIRANWHLLDWEQLETLLGWSEEKLAYILREDDFLDVKLGNFKPDCGKALYRPLTEAEIKRTSEIKASVTAALKSLPPVSAAPFSFDNRFKSFSAVDVPVPAAETRVKTRIVYSYCSLYGDTFSSEELLEASYPESLLSAYRDCGVTGVWTQAVMHTLAPSPFAPSLSEGWEKRLAGVDRLCKRLKKYGLKLYLYLNEPRALPLEYFKDREELMGVKENGYAALCTSVKEVQEWLSFGTETIVRGAPELGGFLTISGSENLTNCFSHCPGGGTTCPHCKDRMPAEVFSEVNALLYRGAARVNPDITFIAWNWGWSPADIDDVIERLPTGVSVMSVSEQGVKKDIGGTETSVIDYSISVIGPGEYALHCWDKASESGHGAFAKVQANVTWECAGLPFLPAFELVYRHIKGVLEKGEINGMMLGWTLGGYPSPTFKILSEMFASKGEIPSLHSIYRKIFPAEAVDTVECAVHFFSKGFYEFPFNIGTAYDGPQLTGPAVPIFRKPTGFKATMVGYPYDDIDSWRSIFPEATYIEQLEKLCADWKKGIDTLKTLPTALISSTPDLNDILEAAEGNYCHFVSCLDLSKLVVARREGKEQRALLENQRRICLKAAELQSKNPTVGYEASNHYFYNRNSLLEKLVNIDWLEDNTD